MEIRLVQFSVVVAGKAHNPTILNPDFLAIREIVPQQWNWEVAQTITTPPFAAVRYQSGISITVEEEKLQVVDVNVDHGPAESRAVEIATKHVETLPHVRYTAVGINYQSVIDVPEPATVLKNRFLREGAWDTADHPVDAVGIRLVYPLADGRLVLSLDVGQARAAKGDKSEPEDVIIVNANFHRDCTDYPADAQVADHLKHAGDDWSRYTDLLSDVLEA